MNTEQLYESYNMLTNFKKYVFICSIETYEECQPTVNTDQTSQQLNKHPEGIVILSYLELIMIDVDKSSLTFITC